MKNKTLLLSVIITGILCTACINSFAIQELNKIGNEYLNKGDYDSAIARFSSGVDLDENIFETRYNLGVAYIGKEDYKNAKETLEYAIKLKPDSKDAYYSLALALEGEGYSFKGEQAFDVENVKEEEPSKEEVIEGIKKLNEALEIYSKYLTLEDKKEEIEKVEKHMEEIKQDIEEFKEQYKIEGLIE